MPYSKASIKHNNHRVGFVSVFLLILVSGCQTSTVRTLTPFTERPTQMLAAVSDNIDFAKKVNDSNILELGVQLKEGQLTSEQLVGFFIQQVALKNQYLNAVITMNPNALEIARLRDQQTQQGISMGILHGIPIMLKDNIETMSMPTTAGSLALMKNNTNRDATLVKRLKDAGAIILAKTNLSEWANFRSERSSSGWSGVGGQTRNPHDLHRSTCGSSSGSGAVVAANLTVAAVGTETDGSVTCPSSANGIVGLKPTVGLISRYGIVPISHSQDTAGPMTKSVVDTAILLSVMQGKDEKDSATTLAKFDFSQNYLPSGNTEILKGLRLGIVPSGPLGHEKVSSLFSTLQQTLGKLGVDWVEELEFEYYDGFGEDSYSVLLYEFKHDLNQYLKDLPNELNRLTLESLITFNQQNRGKEMPFFQQEIFEKSQSKGPLSEPAYMQALAKLRQATREQGIDKVMKENQLDAIISVTLAPAWSIDRINGDHYTGGFSTFPAISGYPHLTIPMGKVNHLPVGLSITAGAMSEAKLLQIGAAIEQIIKRQKD
jgi:amidase